MNFYPFHIGDYISHTSHLSDAEDLAYRRMMDLYYQTEQAFSSAEYVARKVKSTPEIVSVLLDEFFVKGEDGLWHSTRADLEIEKYRSKADSARNANRIKSEKITALKSELKSEPNHIVTKNQEPITINHIKPMKAAPSVDIVFEEAWTSYPKRPGASKQGSFKAWKARLKAGVEAQKMLQGVKRYAEYCKASGIDPQFIKQPATFFGPDEHYLADWTPLASQSQPKELPLGTDAQIEHAYRVECGGDPSKARFNSYFEMRKFIVDRREQRKVAA